ncbi:MAG: FAD-binding protein [Bacteroidetes bacterium]|jgi:uncharacterized protein|nr:FAD-binding protein [Bacteroidota bacterium]MBT6688159.1 FAD-binding protein [Bacteroidota bacterium]MBT7141710.1 FAD-binding protein [Bacteroidota bacterium]MBT7490206.1 FAD-binding protein [Bacteroidota bacterium]
MQKKITLILSPEESSNSKIYRQIVAKKLNVPEKEITNIQITRKSIDARATNIKINLALLVSIGETHTSKPIEFDYKDVSNKSEVHIIGSGPAGLFAALRFIELGVKPIIFERGKSISERKRDIALLNREHLVDTDSNYCFGEGGAGTFSDGKLYTRSKKRGSIQKILEILNYHGAADDILYESHPHVGTDKLPAIVEKIRNTILNAGGEIHFNTKLVDFIVENDKLKGFVTKDNTKIFCKNLILATGHSARDIYELLWKKKVAIEAKSFALGVRVEHPQDLIDSIQYNCKTRSDYLPAATYNLNTQVDGRGIYSFCMCPGGHIVPSASSPNEIVVNGMSASKRNSQFANSGMVVEIRPQDVPELQEYGELSLMKFQQNVEHMAYSNGGKGQIAPAQRLHDFVNKKLSPFLPESSYFPGIISSPLHFWLPEIVSKSLQEGFKKFGRKMKGFLTNEAVIIGVESRTSSPVRIPRNNKTFEHNQIKGLFPCGEGSGYAGGIMSSAIDGENCANSVFEASIS